jgi:hypothetical protein
MALLLLLLMKIHKISTLGRLKMALSEHEVVEKIVAFVRLKGGSFREWYVGIAKDPIDRLFNQHLVNRDGKDYYYEYTHSLNAARNAEQRLINLGFDGGASGGDEQTKAAYVYRKKPTTKP